MRRWNLYLVLLWWATSLVLLSGCGSAALPALPGGSGREASPTVESGVRPKIVASAPVGGEGPTPTAAPISAPLASPTATVAPTRPVQASIVSVALSFYAAVQAQDYARAYSYLANDVTINPTGDRPQPLTRDHFVQTARSLDETMGKVTAFSAEIDANSPTIIIMTISRSNLAAYHSHLVFKDLGGSWKIASLDRI
ncbi:MAG: hypothetical protein IMW90_20390 [Thermogemmatispora sp.]|uniref:hypothetical protein n=1 Tax=Thermogemmatispora sp. TaxID=1968838 RepID=UPI001A051C75|nr:hypothetical protein [Thermogemmatispora sp.]MBE3568083.1 hypothetical protein [Thermogemmatispora sp.]